MPVQPDTRLEQIQFAEAHWPIWNSAPTTIGLTAAAVTAIKTATAAARAAHDAAEAARQASKAATTGYYNTTGTMKGLVADAIKSIRLYAQSTNNPSVYQAAQIPAPATPSPVPPPTQPTDVTASIEPTGALTLTWQGTSGGDSGSTVYLIRRKLSGENSFTMIGAAGTTRGGRYKTFTDDTLPGGSNNIQYIIQGQRGSVMGPDSAVFVVTLGVNGPGVAMVAGVKLAA